MFFNLLHPENQKQTHYMTFLLISPFSSPLALPAVVIIHNANAQSKASRKFPIWYPASCPTKSSRYVIKMRLRFAAFLRLREFLINNFQAVHKLVNANEKMKLHIKPHLTEPTFAKLRDSSKLSSIKITNMMSDLVEFINELVDDQIRMRTCIPLTPELKDFYRKLMGRNVDDESERYEKSVARFLTPKKRFTRKVVSYLLLLRLSTRFIKFH